MPLKYRDGFTIIELLVALLIIGFLLGAASLSFTAAKRSSRDAHRIGDILVTGRAIDQSVTLGRGSYPINMKYPVSAGASNNLLMCADEIVNNPLDTTLDLSLFTGRSVPTDPSPELPRDASKSCAQQVVGSDQSAFVKYGYIYHTEYDHDVYSQGYLAAKQKVTYSLEVLLEGDKPIDEQLLKSPSELGNAFNSTDYHYTPTLGGRSRYIYNGNYCSDSCYK